MQLSATDFVVDSRNNHFLVKYLFTLSDIDSLVHFQSFQLHSHVHSSYLVFWYTYPLFGMMCLDTQFVFSRMHCVPHCCNSKSGHNKP